MKLSRFLFGIVSFVFGALMFLPGMAQASNITLPHFVQAATDLVSAPAGATIMTLAVAGDFSCADLLVTQAKMDEIWVDNAVNKDYMAEVEALKAIMANQTAKLETITNQQEKDKTLKVSWINACGIAGEELGDECEFGGEEASAQCQTYAPNMTRQFPFKVTENGFRTSTYSREEVVAKLLLKACKEADEWLTQSVIAQLDTYKGVNTTAGSLGTIIGSGAVGDSDTKVAPANWNAALMGYFLLTARMNKIVAPWVLSGNNLFLAYWNARMSSGNANGSGDAEMFKSLTPAFDPVNVDSVLSGAGPQTFVLARGSVAFGAHTRYGAAPIEYFDHRRYSVKSMNLPGVSYDVIYKNSCVGDDVTHYWKVIARAGFFLNPVGCTETNTGVLSFMNLA